MIKLHKFKGAWGMPDLSPFCVKVETYLRMIGAPFECVVSDARKGPRQKLPFIDEAGTIVDDSRDIIDHFEAKIKNPLDGGISAEHRALSVAYRALLESEAYFYAVHLRWQLDSGWKIYAPILRGYGAEIGIPGLVAPFVLGAIRRKVVKALWGQGAGRFTQAQVEARLCGNLDAVSTQLGKGPYFLGAEPRTIDATVHAFLWALVEAPFESPVRAHAQTLDNLTRYCAHMRQTYYGEPVSTPVQSATRVVVGSAA
jgi:glutathione S-transferase